MPTPSRIRRKRGPAIAWTPSHESYYVLAGILRSLARTPPLYLTQPAILELEAHLKESSSPAPFGLLAGDLCVCPETELEYLVVDTVVRPRIELGEHDPYTQLASELESLASQQGKHRKLAIGWYLGGMGGDLTLDSEVASVHRKVFPELWQLVLARGTAAGVERGAFQRFEAMSNRLYAIPFFEFLMEPAKRKHAERRTAVRWANYRPSEPALALDEVEAARGRSIATVPARPRMERLMTSLGTIGRGWRTPELRTPAGAAEQPQPMKAPRASEYHAAPSAPATRVAPPTVEQPEALPAPPRSKPLEAAPPAATAPASPPVQAAAPQVAAPVEVEEAPAAPPSEAQQVFINGTLVAVPLSYELVDDTPTHAIRDRPWVTRLLVGALSLLLLFALYLLAR